MHSRVPATPDRICLDGIAERNRLGSMSNDQLFALGLIRPRSSSLFVTLLAFLAIAPARAADPAGDGPPRVLAKGQLPNDHRLQPLKTLDGYFPFQSSKSPAEWAERAERVRRELAVSLGLWPMPEKTPLNAVIHGKIEQPGYTVEKVYFESMPGFFVTGSLYR